MTKILKAALTYFAVVFAAAFALGTIRVMWLLPRMNGPHAARNAELIELPILVVVMTLVARWVVRRFALPPQRGPRLAVGFLALAFVLVSEFIMIRTRGITLPEYFATLDPVSGTAFYLTLLLYALVPALLSNPQRGEPT